ncbi:MAG TPA: hypothetical protein PKA58_27225 [Polyangium sp.]|nr:hypothetical protein [Polyangium sp.]
MVKTHLSSFALVGLGLFVLGAVTPACSSDPSNTSTSTSSSSSSSTSSSGSAGGGGMAGAGGMGSGGMAGGGGMGGGGPSALACQMAGGICIAAGTCTPAGGTVAAGSPGGCFFDDGPAECCIPTQPKMNPTTCAEAGGLCAPIGGCLDAGGYFTSVTMGCDMGASFTCCVPHAQCGDATIECCDGQAVFNPSCDKGMLVCQFGMPVPKGTCLAP